jgi:hypothetical protein
MNWTVGGTVLLVQKLEGQLNISKDDCIQKHGAYPFSVLLKPATTRRENQEVRHPSTHLREQFEAAGLLPVRRSDEFVDLVTIPAKDDIRLMKMEDANGMPGCHATASRLPMPMFPRNCQAQFECAPLCLCRLL